MKRKRLLSFDLGSNTYYVEFVGKQLPVPTGNTTNRRLFVEVSEEEFIAAGEDDRTVPAAPAKQAPRPLRGSITRGPGVGRWTLMLEPQVRESYNAATLAALRSTCENLCKKVAAWVEAAYPGRQVDVFKFGETGMMVVAAGESDPFVAVVDELGISSFAEWA